MPVRFERTNINVDAQDFERIMANVPEEMREDVSKIVFNQKIREVGGDMPSTPHEAMGLVIADRIPEEHRDVAAVGATTAGVLAQLPLYAMLASFIGTAGATAAIAGVSAATMAGYKAYTSSRDYNEKVRNIKRTFVKRSLELSNGKDKREIWQLLVTERERQKKEASQVAEWLRECGEIEKRNVQIDKEIEIKTDNGKYLPPDQEYKEILRLWDEQKQNDKRRRQILENIKASGLVSEGRMAGIGELEFKITGPKVPEKGVRDHENALRKADSYSYDGSRGYGEKKPDGVKSYADALLEYQEEVNRHEATPNRFYDWMDTGLYPEVLNGGKRTTGEPPEAFGNVKNSAGTVNKPRVGTEGAGNKQFIPEVPRQDQKPYPSVDLDRLRASQEAADPRKAFHNKDWGQARDESPDPRKRGAKQGAFANPAVSEGASPVFDLDSVGGEGLFKEVSKDFKGLDNGFAPLGDTPGMKGIKRYDDPVTGIPDLRFFDAAKFEASKGATEVKPAGGFSEVKKSAADLGEFKGDVPVKPVSEGENKARQVSGAPVLSPEEEALRKKQRENAQIRWLADRAIRIIDGKDRKNPYWNFDWYGYYQKQGMTKEHFGYLEGNGK